MDSAAATRRSSRLREGLRESGFPLQLQVRPEACSACLLDIDAADGDGEFVAVLDCCQPRHVFHVDCILTWADQENKCPQCKLRFRRIGIYNKSLDLERLAFAYDQDQGDAGEETLPEEDADDAVCEVCGLGDNEDKLLLCDGQQGTCSKACHYYCIGLRDIPEGDWFCPSCTATNASQRVEECAPVPSPPADGATQKAERPLALVPIKKEPQEHPQGSPPKLPCTTRDATAGTAEGATAKLPPALSGKASSQSKPPSRGRGKAKAAAKVKVEDVDKDSAALVCRKPASGAENSIIELQEVKVENPLASFGRGFPKWISRQGNLVRVDLGGRDLGDEAAKALTDDLTAAVARIFVTSDAKRDLTISWQLAGNALQLEGVKTLLEVGSAAGAHASRVDIERNALDAAAARWLAEWCLHQPGGPPQVLLLAYNQLGQDGASELLHALGKARAARMREPDSKKPRIPVWIEVRENQLDDAESMLESLAAEFEICLAADASVCNALACSASVDAAPEAIPALHLPYIMEQTPPSPRMSRVRILFEDPDNADELQELEPKKLQRLPPAAASPPQKAASGSGRPLVPASPRAPSAPAPAPAPKASSSTAGSGKRRKKQVAESDGLADEGSTKPWYKTLGSRMKDYAPPQVACAHPERPPDKGLWDTVPNQPPKKRQRSSVATNQSEEYRPLAGLQPIFPTRRARTAADKIRGRASQPAKPTELPAELQPRFLVRRTSSQSQLSSASSGQRRKGAELPKPWRRLVSQLLDTENRLWKNIARPERLLRQCCLADQIARKAVPQFQGLMLQSSPPTWEGFLLSSSGNKRACSWIKKRIEEVVRRSSRAAARTTDRPKLKSV